MRRRPIVAFLLGIPVPGLGHVYAGRPGRGLAAVVVLGLVVIPVMAQVALLVAASPLMLLAGVLLVYTPILVLAMDAARLARSRLGASRGGRWRWPLYLVWPVVAWAVVLGGYRILIPVMPIRLFTVVTGSMTPAILPWDTVVTRLQDPEAVELVRGRVVLFESPERPGEDHFDRLVGLPGETVEIRDGQVLIDGEPLDEPWKVHESRLDPPAFLEVREGRRVDPDLVREMEERIRLGGTPGFGAPPALAPLEWGPMTIPDDAVFVLGDNRDNAKDSRFYGPIAIEALRGYAIRTFWSRSRGTGEIRWSRIGAPL